MTRLRARGVRIPTDTRTAVPGNLHVEEMTHTDFGRALTIARLTHLTRPAAAPEQLPPLFDVSLLKIDKEKIVLAGIERETVDGQLTDFAQTWLAQLTDAPT